MSSSLNVLMLCNLPARHSNASTIADHILAYPRYSRHRVFVLSHIGALPTRLDLDRFDVVLVHYSLVLPDTYYLSLADQKRIGAFGGLTVRISQDEYRQVSAMIEALRRMNVDLLFTCVPEPGTDIVYPPSALPKLRKEVVLTGCVPEALLGRRRTPIAKRRIDVGYRARRLPYWMGALAQEKSEIVPRFLEATAGMGLRCDLSVLEEDRLYGERWISFLSNCRVTLGVESGTSITDFSGDIERTVNAYVAEHPSASFAEVSKLFLRDVEGNVALNQISPRCFEAAALGTPMVLYEGQYSGVLQAWRHYVPLRKDFGNIDQVVSVIRDDRLLQEMADRTYEEIACNPAYSYRAMVDHFDNVVEQEYAARGHRSARPGYSKISYRRDILRSTGYSMRRVTALVVQHALLREGAKPLRHIWQRLPMSVRDLIRPYFSR